MKIIGFKSYVFIVTIYSLLFIILFSFFSIRDRINLNNKPALLVTSTVVTPAGKNLVPFNAIQGENDTNEVKLEFSVKTPDSRINVLQVNFLNVKIGDSDEYAELVNYTISKGPSNNKGEVLVTILVSLDIPPNYDAYLAIKGKVISFEVHFSSENYVNALKAFQIKT